MKKLNDWLEDRTAKEIFVIGLAVWAIMFLIIVMGGGAIRFE